MGVETRAEDTATAADSQPSIGSKEEEDKLVQEAEGVTERDLDDAEGRIGGDAA